MSAVSASQVRRKSISLDAKLQGLRLLEAGERMVDFSAASILATSTVRTIIKNTDKIKVSAMTTMKLTAMMVNRSRSRSLERIKGRLSIHICGKAASGDAQAAQKFPPTLKGNIKWLLPSPACLQC
ncbi:CENPB DNA-binding domain containing protein 1-like 40 [Homarus americanus]|uniref:CENPB DNA-binding domain containing protein 1-like 40 n=1 Tax=Homarus americanus TaxID=6706 RepID=A0A8J5JLI1_HOMAM|nr:CENPB DNA-binding domain containing protein 1-like 40 [Homarus americanus]